MAHGVTSRMYHFEEDRHTNHQKDNGELLFFSSIDDATKSWLSSLHRIWGLWKKSNAVTKTLTDYFDTAPNPYLSTLRILVNTSDFNHIKSRSSLAVTVIEEFSNWLSSRKDMYKECLVLDLKLAAFMLVSKQKNMLFIKLVSDVYEFVKDKELFLPMVQKLLEKKKFKEAAQFAAMLYLQSHFANPEIVLLPLILQSKLAVVDDFIAPCPDIQKNLVMYLDNLMAPGSSMHNTLHYYIQNNMIPDVKMSTTETRPMARLVARLAKTYNLSPDVCPNLNQRRGEGALQFLMYKRYMEGSMSVESWREMAREAVGNNTKLQTELVKILAGAGDHEEALYWAKTYNVPKQQWPWSLTHMKDPIQNQQNSGASGSGEETWDTEEDSVIYHELQLPMDCIKVIDNPRSFEEFFDEGLKGVSIVGIDSEWKPSFGIKQSELALIQIATETNVYILDVTTMGSELTNLWTELRLVLFENKNIIKLGFSLAHDVTMMRESLPAMSNVKACGQGYVDMLQLWRKLVQEHKFEFPFKGDESFTNESLSKLVEICTGNRLKKTEQFSNWERRPLRENQIIYAALDAYCLLEIFEVLQDQCQRMGIPFQEVCAEVQHIAHKSPKKPPKKALPKDGAANSRATRSTCSQEYQVLESRPVSVPAHEWRVVCDSMLGGLAKQLRICGCDCVYVEFDCGGDRSAKLAMQERRVLLSRGGACQRFAHYLPPGNCYNVISDKLEDQLKEVLSQFNVLVMQRDIFSRCQLCNQDEFVHVSRHTMAELVKSFARRIHGSDRRPGRPSSGPSFNGEVTGRSDRDRSFFDLERKQQDRTWRLCDEDTLDVVNCTTKFGILVQIGRIPNNVVRNVQHFYVCEYCGKVYWDGSHMERALSGVLRDIIVQE
ncbi:exonuclease mut-7 homolog [Orussus abietinus]|uniref:exonuclease mut-7 homolog n=1 Tax=Orussus abietinus TaxID=222816 RepID=UPI0006257D56|nr:exonuclease mut-7 homolog [Orussus abietinus]XP_012279442.1 exonuclease mut-7 homolog [Orussus abietinus]XP_012279443.1 exonuclease mut-7 homolog [Orussus abietinus]XP_012279444.1 exonuclease mut-7 homolog [Orussus abietinus]XP_023289665.1 exonuclease mut-7 homolog [Orussus abietinus]